MNAEALATLATGGSCNRDVDGAMGRRQKLPERGGAVMTDGCPLAARKYSSHQPAFEREPGVSDRVDTAMDSM